VSLISFIIPTYEKVNFTKSCLKDLFRLSIPFEVIVVDNSQTNETYEMCLDYKKYNNFKYLRSSKNTFSHACNTGYKNASGEYLCFLNNDIRVKENHDSWPNLLISTIKDYEKNGENIIIGPTGGMLDNNFNFLYETRDANKKINYISGWCLTLSKAVAKILEISEDEMWDERFKFYFEDADIGFRAQQKNIKLVLKDIPVVHFGKISTDKTQINKLYNEGKKIFTSIYKNNTLSG